MMTESERERVAREAMEAIDRSVAALYVRQMLMVNAVRKAKGLPLLPLHPDAAPLAGAIVNAELFTPPSPS